jgi:glycosyltransferase involved in cell wall biosynthesis
MSANSSSASNEQPRIICVTPVRNEAWIIERFLTAAELWADHIIVADQSSTDDTVALARNFEKVRVLTNSKGDYDEGHRQQLLIAAAREIPGPRVIVALDADEFLSPTWDSPEWQRAIRADPGTVLSFEWVNLLPDGQRAWIPPHKIPYAFVDDGSDHAGAQIHATRIPVGDNAPICVLSETKVLHLQYTDWPRMKSKQRWYQCWERINDPDKRPIQIYRQYHRMDSFPADQLHATRHDWIERYRTLGIDVRPRPSSGPYWWDEEVLEWLLEQGPDTFARVDVWDEDWNKIAARLGKEIAPVRVADPRRFSDRVIHRWLRRTQRTATSSRTRWCQRALIPFGW